MNANNSKAFDDADFYDTSGDPGELDHETLEAALADLLDSAAETRTEAIEKVAPVLVDAFERKKLDPSFSEDCVGSWIVELGEDSFLYERWSEEYGDCLDGDGGPLENVPNDELEAFKAEVVEKLHALLEKHPSVWQCDKVASRKYSAEELREMFVGEEAP